MVKKTLKVEDFSATLFWDVDKAQVDFEAHKSEVIQKVLALGTLSDWRLIKAFYGLDVIKEVALGARYLDKQSLAFCSGYFDIPKELFRCYTLKQLNLTHWDY